MAEISRAAHACRPGCAACCIAPSISSLNKPAGEPCRHLDGKLLCTLFGRAERPACCSGLQPSLEMCGENREEALHWLAALEANMLTPIALMKAVVDGMAHRGFGRIVNITSGAVKAPIDTLGLSNGARSGLTGFVAGLARQSRLAAANVTINNLLPGAFDTERLGKTLVASAERSGQALEQVRQQRAQGIPARRFGTAAEFGAVCAMLCSAQAGYLTGQNVLLDGGAYPGTF